MEQTNLATIRHMLEISTATQLLFDQETLVAFSKPAARLFPGLREGLTAETLLGDGIADFRRFSGSGTMLFSLELMDLVCDVTLTMLEGYRLVTLTPPEAYVGLNTMLAIAEGVRQPMTNLLSITPRLMELLEDSPDPKVMESAGEVNRSLCSILRTTSNLQLYGSHGRLRLHRESLDLGQWLATLCDQVAPLCQEAGKRLELRCSAGRYPCVFDPERMERVLLNLISNAMKFSPQNTTITLELRRAGRRLILSIRDHGCGIPADQMAQVFTRSENHGLIPDPHWGIGLGLPIVRDIVQLHEGQIMLESQEARGTAVHIALPMRPTNDSPDLHTPVKRPDYAGGFNHVLMELSDVLPASVFDPRGLNG